MMQFFLGLLLGFLAGWWINQRRQRPDTAPTRVSPRVLIEERPEPVKREPARPQQVARSSPAVEETPDRLQEIDGIGPVFARRLNEAGIRTYTELARTEPDRLREIVSSPLADVDTWIAQARQLTAGKR